MTSTKRNTSTTTPFKVKCPFGCKSGVDGKGKFPKSFKTKHTFNKHLRVEHINEADMMLIGKEKNSDVTYYDFIGCIDIDVKSGTLLHINDYYFCNQ